MRSHPTNNIGLHTSRRRAYVEVPLGRPKSSVAATTLGSPDLPVALIRVRYFGCYNRWSAVPTSDLRVHHHHPRLSSVPMSISSTIDPPIVAHSRSGRSATATTHVHDKNRVRVSIPFLSPLPFFWLSDNNPATPESCGSKSRIETIGL